MKTFFYILVMGLCFQGRAQSVTSFDPSALVLPSNTLRFYLNFDRPSRGLIHQRDVKLFDSKNLPIENAFMDFGQELWSPDGKRLTVMFDPGKVKRRVEAVHSELSPLKEGEKYKLALGNFSYRFQAGPALREKIDPAAWTISMVKRPTAAIKISFDRVMDTALLEDQLEVEDEKGRPISGIIRATHGGRGARFTPTRPFKKATYQIRVSPIFEDVAGNRMSETLDHLVSEKPSDSVGVTRLRVYFKP